MKSSGAIFTRQNIFPPDPRIPKTHYNPSPTKKMSKKQRKTNLSPVRLAKPSSHSAPEMEPLTLLRQPSNPLPFTPPSTVPQPSFSESWPSTDHESSTNTTASPQNEVLTRVASSEKHQASSVPPTTQQDSVLAKYVERFRHGQPQSREERQRSAAAVEDWQPFWWLSSSSRPHFSPATTKPAQQGHASANKHAQLSTSPTEHMRSSPPFSPHGTPLDFTVTGLSDSSHCEPSDPGILQLQERAGRLLQRSVHSLSSSSLPISSEGVGSSDLSSPVNVDEPVQRPVVPSLINPTTALNSGPTAMPSVGALLTSRTRPEDDILFQWRLRRKMEQARQWPLPHSQGLHQPQAQRGLYTSGIPTQPSPRAAQHFTPVLQGPSVPREPPATASPPSFPVASPAFSSLPPDISIAPHMHLLCDMLPCPLQYRPRERRGSPKKWEVPTRDPAHGPPKGHSSSTESEDLPSKESSSPPPPSSETAEDQRPAGERNAGRPRKNAQLREEPQRSEIKRTVPSCSKKKSTRVAEGNRGDSQKGPVQTERGVSRDRVEEGRVTPWPEEPGREQWERGQRSRKEGRPGDRAPPPSPIHSVLGQVVSEVLFPTVDSPLPPTTSSSLDSPGYTPPVPPQSPAPAPSMPRAPEVVSQLLQEAEESDGLEFEDDPLLQVLRQQREWVKEQISEVETILNEVEDDT